MDSASVYGTVGPVHRTSGQSVDPSVDSDTGAAGAAPGGPVEPIVRVATLNLWHDRIRRISRAHLAGALLAEHGVSVALVQELTADTYDTVVGAIEAESGLRVVSHSGIAGSHTVTAVLTHLPAEAEAPIPCDTPVVQLPYGAAVATIRTPSGARLRACSAHLAWGGRNEWARLDQAVRIDAALCARGSVDGMLLGGDCNTSATSATIRYLTGLDIVDGTCTQWTDAHARIGSGDGATSYPENPWAIATGRRFGFMRPEWLPRRRIDYLLIHGYAHGHRYTPIRVWTADTVAGASVPASDHAAVIADLYDPPLE